MWTSQSTVYGSYNCKNRSEISCNRSISRISSGEATWLTFPVSPIFPCSRWSVKVYYFRQRILSIFSDGELSPSHSPGGSYNISFDCERIPLGFSKQSLQNCGHCTAPLLQGKAQTLYPHFRSQSFTPHKVTKWVAPTGNYSVHNLAISFWFSQTFNFFFSFFLLKL